MGRGPPPPSPAPRSHVLTHVQHLRLYDVPGNRLVSKVDCQAPVLACDMSSPHMGFCGSVDGKVRRWDVRAPPARPPALMHRGSVDFNTNTATVLGTHELAARCVEHSAAHGAAPRPPRAHAAALNLPAAGMLLSGSWDRTVKQWDPRARGGEVGSYPQPDKVFSMSTVGDKLVVGTAGRHVWIYDVRNLGVVEQRKESSLKFQTRCVAMNPAGDGYVVTSIEGRASVEWVDPSPQAQLRKFAFKCHRAKDAEGKEVIYPVNAVAFHPVHGTFATGGCDGIVNIWDGIAKRKLCQTKKYPTSIAALAFSHSGEMMAVASSYTYEEGDKEHPADAIYIVPPTEEQVKPR